MYKSPDSDRIPAELNQAGSETLLSEIHKLCGYGTRHVYYAPRVSPLNNYYDITLLSVRTP
jgi:hypothetical protein